MSGRMVSAAEARDLGDEYDDDINVANLAHTVSQQFSTIRLLATACEEVLAAYHQLSGLGDEWKGNSDLAYETISGRLTEQAEQIAAVRALHAPEEIDVVTGECTADECDHENGCPTIKISVCSECREIAEAGTPYALENSGATQRVEYPCETAHKLKVTA